MQRLLTDGGRRHNPRVRPGLPDIKLLPATASLRVANDLERRDVASRKELLRRIHSEFEEMPGLSLTLAQAARLFGISHQTCSRILLRFTEQRLLCLRRDSRYVRADGVP